MMLKGKDKKRENESSKGDKIQQDSLKRLEMMKMENERRR